MKFVVDKLPNKCEECQFCADAMMMSPLGVAKQVSVCTLVTSLIPPKPDATEPPVIDKNLNPVQNNCICTDNLSEASSKIIL